MQGHMQGSAHEQLVSIAPAPWRVSQIEVTFNIDASGIDHVSAKHKASAVWPCHARVCASAVGCQDGLILTAVPMCGTGACNDSVMIA